MNAWMDLTAEQRLADVKQRREPMLHAELERQHLAWGARIFLRIFKEERVLECWLQRSERAPWVQFQSWPIAAMSGELGPKQREGDKQAPEGVYTVTEQQLNPMSRYHLSFNLGYPNTVDAALGRTGSLIMVHGGAVSVGCFAMTDPVIEVLYLLAYAALKEGKQDSFPVHVFPFRMTAQRLAEAKQSVWHSFWSEELLPLYERFEQSKVPPTVMMEDGRYRSAGDSPASS